MTLDFAEEDRSYSDQPRVEEAAKPGYGNDGGTDNEYAFGAATGSDVDIERALSESKAEPLSDDIDIL